MTLPKTAAAFVQDVKTGAIKVADAIEDALNRIAEIEPTVEAFAFLDPELARARAADLDATEAKGPLAGVTVVVKDMIATRDMPTGHNNVRYEGVMTGVDAAPVDTLRCAGAVILGKTVTTEFAATGRGGKTRNPHDPTRTPGGSSSGSAAAVASGMAQIGLGTQTGGSTIRPASYNGVWGWKPSWNVISREGLKVYSLTCDTLGLYARAAEDFELLADVFDLDPAAQPRSLRGLKIAYVKPPAWNEVEDPMRNALDKAAAALVGAGAAVSELVLPDSFRTIDESHGIILAREGRAAFLNEARAQPDTLHDEFRAMVENRAGITPDAARAAYVHADACRAELDGLLSGYDAIIAPSATSEAPVGLGWTGNPNMNSIWTLMSVPVVSVPGFTGPNGMPLGISVITRRYTDRTAIAIAKLAGPVFAAAA